MVSLLLKFVNWLGLQSEKQSGSDRIPLSLSIKLYGVTLHLAKYSEKITSTDGTVVYA